jgi:hypothetical protein
VLKYCNIVSARAERVKSIRKTKRYRGMGVASQCETNREEKISKIHALGRLGRAFDPAMMPGGPRAVS